MTSHVHLLLASGEAVAGPGQIMKTLAAKATRYRNKLEGRTGTLWKSRYKSSLVQTDQYLLACDRYIEPKPARASWSTGLRSRNAQAIANAWAWLRKAGSITIRVFKVAETKAARCVEYRRYLSNDVPEIELFLIRQALQRGQLTGNNRFIDQVEKILGRRIELRVQGRPREGQ